MDLTKYLGPSRKVNQSLERKEQYKNQGKTNALDRNKRTQILDDNRKENRSKQILNRRGIENNEAEEMSLFSENQDSQQSLTAQQTKSGNSNKASKQKERLNMLQKYQEKQKGKKEKEKANKKMPFLAGIAGIRSSESDLYSRSIKNLGSSSSKPMIGSSSSKKLNTPLPRALQDNNKNVLKFTGKRCQGNENPTNSRSKKASNTLSTVEFERKEPTSFPVAIECNSDKIMTYNTPSNLTTLKENLSNTRWPVDTRMSTPEDIEHDAPNISIVDNALNEGDNQIIPIKRKEMGLAKKQSQETEIKSGVKISSTPEKMLSPLIDMEKEKVFDGEVLNVQSPISSLKSTPNSKLTSMEQPIEESNFDGTPRYCSPSNCIQRELFTTPIPTINLTSMDSSVISQGKDGNKPSINGPPGMGTDVSTKLRRSPRLSPLTQLNLTGTEENLICFDTPNPKNQSGRKSKKMEITRLGLYLSPSKRRSRRLTMTPQKNYKL